MNSALPKVLHKVLNKPMIVRVIEESIMLNPLKIIIVVGKYRDHYQLIRKQLVFVDQPYAQ